MEGTINLISEVMNKLEEENNRLKIVNDELALKVASLEEQAEMQKAIDEVINAIDKL